MYAQSPIYGRTYPAPAPVAATHAATVQALQADLARVQAQLNALLAQLAPPVATFTPSAAYAPAATPAPRGRGTFYAVNGWFGDLPFIGYGMNRLQQGATGDSTAYSRHSEGRILREIVEKHRNGTLARPLVLVGHSLGGGAVTRIASELNAHGIAVDYLGVIDAPYPVPITPNVRKVDNFLTTASLIGKRLTRGEEIRLAGVSHIALGDHPVVHQRIREQAGLV